MIWVNDLWPRLCEILVDVSGNRDDPAYSNCIFRAVLFKADLVDRLVLARPVVLPHAGIEKGRNFMNAQKIVVIGGSAAGPKAAAPLKTSEPGRGSNIAAKGT